MKRPIRIAHLYYNLMNLYGENGNIRILAGQLSKLGYQVDVDYLSTQDQLDLSSYQLVYIGTGTEHHQLIALDHLRQYQTKISNYIEAGGLMLVTGNAMELFGQKIIDRQGTEIPMLALFSYYSVHGNRRIINEVVADSWLGPDPVIGVQNQYSNYHDLTSPLFKLVKGHSGGGPDGHRYKNFYATSILGPLLARNPQVLTYFLTQIIIDNKKLAQSADPASSDKASINTPIQFDQDQALNDLPDFDLRSEYRAYNQFVKNYL